MATTYSNNDNRQQPFGWRKMMRGRNVLTFITCLALSTLFWYIVVLGEEYEREFDIQVQLKNVPENVIVTTPLPSTVKVILKDKASRLLAYQYYGSLPAVSIDFTNYDQRSGHVTLQQSDISKVLFGYLQPSSKVVAIKPDVLEYYYNYGLHAKFPVRLNAASFEAAPYYSVSSVKLIPDSVTVYSSQDVLDTMQAVYVDTLHISNINKRMVRRINLREVEGAKFEPATALVRIDVDQIADKSVVVPVRWDNFPSDKVLRTFPSSVKVTFQVGMSIYKHITAEDFVVSVSYDDVLHAEGNHLRLKIKSMPANVNHVRIWPESIEYLIEDVKPEEG